MKRYYSKLILFILLMLLCGCQEKAEETEKIELQTTAVSETQTVATADIEETTQQQEELPEVTDIEVKKAETELEILILQTEEIEKTILEHSNASATWSEDKIEELAEQEVVRCYEENVALAVEIKSLLMGSLGVDVPTGFSSNSDEMYEDYGDYLEENVMSGVDSILSEVASEEVKSLIITGVTAGAEGFADGGISGALENAKTSLESGVIATIQEAPMKMALNILDETTGGISGVLVGIAESGSIEEYIYNSADEELGGLLGSVKNIVTYEQADGAFYQTLSNNASDTAERLKNFLDNESVTANDISNMLAQYSLFGNTMRSLVPSYDWELHYGQMNKLYRQFTRNEIMIEILTSRLEEENIEIQNIEKAEENITETTHEEFEGLQMTVEPDENNAVYYARLQEKIAELEEYNENLLKNQRESEKGLEQLEEYRKQVSDIYLKYNRLMKYTVDNFEPNYRIIGSDVMERNNKISNAIGEIAKYTPYGLVVNLFTSMSISYIDELQKMTANLNDAIGTSYQAIVADSQNEITELVARYDFYHSLVSEYRDTDKMYKNQRLLQYILGDEKINIDSYAYEVQKQLCVMAMGVDLAHSCYQGLAGGLSSMEEQYDELMMLADPEGTGEIAESITDEELCKYLLPMIKATVQINDVIVAKHAIFPQADAIFSYTYSNSTGRVYRYYYNNTVRKVKDDGNYYVADYAGDGSPIRVNSIYMYKNRVLMENHNIDADALYELAVDLRTESDDRGYEDKVMTVKSIIKGQ